MAAASKTPTKRGPYKKAHHGKAKSIVTVTKKRGKSLRRAAKEVGCAKSTAWRMKKLVQAGVELRSQKEQRIRRAVSQACLKLLQKKRGKDVRRKIVTQEEVRTYIEKHSKLGVEPHEIPKKTKMTSLVRGCLKGRNKPRPMNCRVKNTGITTEQLAGLRYHSQNW